MDLLLVLDDLGIIQAYEVAPGVKAPYPSSAVLGHSLTDFLPPDQAETITSQLTGNAQAGMRTATLTFRQATGGWCTFEASAVPLPTNTHRGWWVVAGRDLTKQRQTENLLYTAEARFRTLVEQMPTLVYLSPIDAPGLTLYASPYIETLLDYTAEEWQGTPTLWLERLHPDDRERVRAQSALTRETGAPFSLEYRLLARDGHTVWVQDQALIIRDATGKPQFWQGVVFDITLRKQAERLLTSQKQVLEQIAEGVPLAKILDLIARLLEAQADGVLCSILFTDATGTTLHVGAAPSLPEFYRQAIDGTLIGPMTSPCAAAAFRQEPVLTTDIATDPTWEGYREAATEAGLRACWSTPIFSSDQQVLGTFTLYYRTSRDPSSDDQHLIDVAVQLSRIAIERQKAADQLTHQAFFDRLTDLPNRALFEDRLGQALARARRRSQIVAVQFIDLDGFKAVNDYFGHDMGDLLLVRAANRLRDSVRSEDTVARFGGDEFVLLLEEGDDHEANLVAERILENLRRPFSLADHQIVVTPSIGVAFNHPGDGEPFDLVRAADQAMYAAKRQGGNRVVVFVDLPAAGTVDVNAP